MEESEMRLVIVLILIMLSMYIINNSMVPKANLDHVYPSSAVESLSPDASKSNSSQSYPDYSSGPIVINSFTVEDPFVKRIDVNEQTIGICADIIFYNIDWNSMEFNQKGEIAKEALILTYNVLRENSIEIVSVSGNLESGDLLFSLTDGIGNIIIWDIGQTDYAYGPEDIYFIS